MIFDEASRGCEVRYLVPASIFYNQVESVCIFVEKYCESYVYKLIVKAKRVVRFIVNRLACLFHRFKFVHIRLQQLILSTEING